MWRTNGIAQPPVLWQRGGVHVLPVKGFVCCLAVCRDVLFCHRPDPDTPIEETVRAMNWVINQVGSILNHWG